ncbi:MAG: hypothetical protein ACPLYF_05385, partial [Fervidobacterium sp.]
LYAVDEGALHILTALTNVQSIAPQNVSVQYKIYTMQHFGFAFVGKQSVVAFFKDVEQTLAAFFGIVFQNIYTANIANCKHSVAFPLNLSVGVFMFYYV